MPVDHLNFDCHSARLVEFGVTRKTTDEEMIQLLWDTMDIHELVLSISAGGFFRHERLVVAREEGKNIVIEGNRRLAAVRVLLQPGIVDFGHVTIPKLSRDARESLHYGSKRESQPPAIARQNPHLRQLAAVLGNREAVAALRDGISLDVAFELSRPASTVLEEALLDANRNLQKARRLISTGYEGSRELLGITGTVADLAGDLYDEIERKHRPQRRRRVTEC